jgi:hypothetical protein
LKNFRRKPKLLQDNQTEIIDKMNNQSNQELGLATVKKYVFDLKVVLESAWFMEQKGFLRSFVERLSFDRPKVVIDYTIPLPVQGGLTSKKEVLSIGTNGSRFRCPGEPFG